MIISELEKSIFTASPVHLVESGEEKAWAEKFVSNNKFIRYFMGSYVEADRANQNGQYFALADLEKYSSTLDNAPMNINHSPPLVGTYVANEIVIPIDTAGAEVNPFVETLAAFWTHRFPDLWTVVERAYREGILFQSMECVPEKIKCMGEEGCGNSFEYAGRTDPSYCEHINDVASHAVREMTSPHFAGGGLIIPPSRPGWADAQIREVASYVNQSQEAQHLYEQLATENPHMDARDCELVMSQIVAAWKVAEEAMEQGKGETVDKRKEWAKQGIAMADGSFPIPDVAHLKSAIKLVGNGKASKAAVKAHIKRRAKALNATNLLPDTWK